MLASIKKYTPESVEFIYKMLQSHQQSGRKPAYEVWVDNLPIVPRTENLEMFRQYSNHIGGESKELKIIVYQGKSNHNDKYIFRLAEEVGPGFQGFGNTDHPMQSFEGLLSAKLMEAEQRWEQQRLNDRLDTQQAVLQEKEKYIETLEGRVKKYEEEEKSSLLAGMLGSFGAKMVDAAIQNSPRLSGLLGVGEETEKAAQVQFRPKPEDKYLLLAEQMRKDFNPEEFRLVSQILYYLSRQKQDLTAIHTMIYQKEKNTGDDLHEAPLHP